MTDEQYSEIIATLHHIYKTQERMYAVIVAIALEIIVVSIFYGLSR